MLKKILLLSFLFFAPQILLASEEETVDVEFDCVMVPRPGQDGDMVVPTGNGSCSVLDGQKMRLKAEIALATAEQRRKEKKEEARIKKAQALERAAQKQEERRLLAAAGDQTNDQEAQPQLPLDEVLKQAVDASNERKEQKAQEARKKMSLVGCVENVVVAVAGFVGRLLVDESAQPDESGLELENKRK